MIVAASGWTPANWIALTAILASAAVSLGVTYWTQETALRQRLASEMATARREAATLLGPVYVLVSDAYPGWVRPMTETQKQERIEALGADWRSVRESLAGLAAGFPVESVRNQAWALVAALDESVIASLECNTMPPAADRAEAFKAASAKHKVAQEAAQALAAEVRGPDVDVSRLKERAAL